MQAKWKSKWIYEGRYRRYTASVPANTRAAVLGAVPGAWFGLKLGRVPVPAVGTRVPIAIFKPSSDPCST